MQNLFLKNSEGKIFKVNHICMCKECKKREMPELFLDDLNGDYADCIKVSDLFSGEWTLSNHYRRIQHDEQYI